MIFSCVRDHYPSNDHRRTTIRHSITDSFPMNNYQLYYPDWRIRSEKRSTPCRTNWDGIERGTLTLIHSFLFSYQLVSLLNATVAVMCKWAAICCSPDLWWDFFTVRSNGSVCSRGGWELSDGNGSGGGGGREELPEAAAAISDARKW